MRVVFKNVNLPESCCVSGTVNVIINNDIIEYIGKDEPSALADRVIEEIGRASCRERV